MFNGIFIFEKPGFSLIPKALVRIPNLISLSDCARILAIIKCVSRLWRRFGAKPAKERTVAVAVYRARVENQKNCVKKQLTLMQSRDKIVLIRSQGSLYSHRQVELDIIFLRALIPASRRLRP